MAALEGQCVLITGGASGLGLAIVERFIEEGARMTVLDRSAERLAALASRFAGSVEAVVGDVRSTADNQRAVEAGVARFGRLDCAIGNAGIWDYSRPLDAIALESIDSAFDEVFHINVKGYLHLAKASLPALVRSSGSLIFTVSNAGFDPAGGGALYTASKHAVVGLIRQLAYEFAPAVRVNGVAPGPIETDLRGPAALGLADRSISSIDLTSAAAPTLPLGRVPATASYTGAFVLLASRSDGAASTGAVVSLDSGAHVRGFGRSSLGERLVEKYRT